MEPVAKPDDSIFELREAEPSEPNEPFAVESQPGKMDSGIEAEFMLEAAAVCPHCHEDMHKVHVVRMLRTKVNFVSSLPRKGQLLVCPKCRTTLAGALGGLL